MAQQIIGWDVETFRFAPGMPFPKLVCLSWDDGNDRGVMLDDEGLVWFRQKLLDPNVVLVAHNANYDTMVMGAEDHTLLPLIFRARREGRLRCTKVREKIIQNATGELYYEWDEELESYKGSSFALQRLIWKHFRVFLKKEEDTWRLRYSELYRVPISSWPEDAITYSISDSTWARALYLKQDEIVEGEEIPGELHVTRTSITLAGVRSWGVRTDPGSVEELREQITTEYQFWLERAQATGLVRASGTRDMKAIKRRVVDVYNQFGLAIPPTKKGDVCTDRETLTFSGGESRKIPRHGSLVGPDGKNIPCVDTALKCISELVRVQKLLSNYVPTLVYGTRYPITPDYNEMVETFRTSCSKPNLQNQGRGGGVRKCFKPRDGWTFAFCDFDSLEMRTLAQTCIDLFGYSFIAEAIKEDKDLHVDLATETLGGMDYKEAMRRYADGDKILEDVRQGSKIGNYGMAGGMGPDAFVDYARGYGVEMTIERAREIHRAFRRKWREVVDYFNYCSNLCDGSDAKTVVHPRTKMVRGHVRYTSLCNFFFQHLAAIGATEALANAFEETVDPSLKSPLYGCRIWYFGHDEIGMEIPTAVIGTARASAAALRLQTVMIESMKKWVPDVPIGATVCMSRRWLKGAKPVFVNGLLVPSKPQKDASGKTIWVADIDERRAAA